MINSTPPKVLYTSNQDRRTPDSHLGSGGETDVYTCRESGKLAVAVPKVVTPEKLDRLRFLVVWFPALSVLKHFAWPKEILTDSSGKPVGFSMQRVDGELLGTFLHPTTRPSSMTLATLLVMFRSLASVIHAAHASGFRVGDLNDFNVMVKGDGSVVVLDVLSFYFCHDQTVFSTDAGVAEYLPPELQGAFQNGTLGDEPRTVHGDSWAFGVLLFKGLMENFHPFSNRECEPVDEAVIQANWPHSSHGRLHPKSGCPPLTALPKNLIDLFRQCFEAGAVEPGKRPLMIDWHGALDEWAESEKRTQKQSFASTGSQPISAPLRIRTALGVVVCIALVIAVGLTASKAIDPTTNVKSKTTGRESPKLWTALRNRHANLKGE